MDSSSIDIQHLVETYLKDYNIAHEIIEIDPDKRPDIYKLIKIFTKYQDYKTR